MKWKWKELRRSFAAAGGAVGVSCERHKVYGGRDTQIRPAHAHAKWPSGQSDKRSKERASAELARTLEDAI